MFTKDDGVDQGNRDNETPKVSECHNSTPKFSIPDVTAKLQRLNSDKSAGPDGIHPKLLRSCAVAVAEPLSMIFTSSFESGEVPEDWRTAVIVPFYKKKGLRSDPTNYRPVSLTSVPCKIMESLIRHNLVEFTESNNILTKHQHGFMQCRSCLTNLLEALEAWMEALDEGLGVEVLFLDYRKAFDSVAHR